MINWVGLTGLASAKSSTPSRASISIEACAAAPRAFKPDGPRGAGSTKASWALTRTPIQADLLIASILSCAKAGSEAASALARASATVGVGPWAGSGDGEPTPATLSTNGRGSTACAPRSKGMVSYCRPSWTSCGALRRRRLASSAIVVRSRNGRNSRSVWPQMAAHGFLLNYLGIRRSCNVI
jgi:hypothetical protein